MRMQFVRRASAWLAMLMLLAGIVTAPARAQLKVEQIKVHGASLEGNLEGNSADRDVFVVLPQSYASAKDRRYPVVYFLHGFSAHASGYMELGKIAAGMQAAQTAAGQELIFVVPDSYTRHAGAMYSNSPTTGNFEDFIARDLVAAIDSRYRTVATRESRGLSGHSMGGYGTLKIGMKYPQVFSSLYAMSACCLSPRTITSDAGRKLEGMSVADAQKGDFMTRANFAAAAAWSPAPDKPPLFLDIGTKDGVVDPLVVAKWAANAPLAMLPQYVAALKGMTAVAMDVGDKDFLLSDNVAMHEQLTRYGIAHDWQLYEGDHVNRVAQQFEAKVVPFFARHLKGS